MGTRTHTSAHARAPDRSKGELARTRIEAKHSLKFRGEPEVTQIYERRLNWKRGSRDHGKNTTGEQNQVGRIPLMGKQGRVHDSISRIRVVRDFDAV